ncbi:MAG: methylenetetrahydrofolate reductase, partial [Proteobacteria bacterium]|nr:methylenetetrahydrofolate reductase [Pseudomonadota bacterium]
GSIVPGSEFLPHAMSVYVPLLAKRDLMSNLDILKRLRNAGFNPVPHIAARRVTSEEVLKEFLSSAVNEAGIKRVLLIAGDIDEPAGPYFDTLDVLRSEILPANGIQEVSIAGYPEGHPRIPQQKLIDALGEKLVLADSNGLDASVLTQFSFVPKRIIQFCSDLGRNAPGIPVYVGMAGPTDMFKLMRYAKICGVSTSWRALSEMGMKAAKLAMHTDPGKQLEALAQHCAMHPGHNIIGVHMFSFGGFIKSAKWMHETISFRGN